MLTRPEIYRLVHDYIGVSSGYLGDFSYRTHQEFYPYYCDLDIDPLVYEGTTRERFINILESSDSTTQAKIVNGVLKKYPVSYFPVEQREQKQALFDEFTKTLTKLNSTAFAKQGAAGEVKNLIFAANGPKPEIVLADSISNRIEIVKNAEHCLVYDLLIPENGLDWDTLIEWWARKNKLSCSHIKTGSNLLSRLQQSLASEPERLLFNTYYLKLCPRFWCKNFPALVPQVYLHYDQKTLKDLQGKQRFERQRMDFLILFSNSDRVVIEVDGKQHYADGDVANSRKYAEMVAADRKLRLAGYELYRFGGYELQGENGEVLVEQFFIKLLEKYGISESDF